jgi:hypothetical protein
MVPAVDGALVFHTHIVCLLSKHVKPYFECSTEIFMLAKYVLTDPPHACYCKRGGKCHGT